MKSPPHPPAPPIEESIGEGLFVSHSTVQLVLHFVSPLSSGSQSKVHLSLHLTGGKFSTDPFSIVRLPGPIGPIGPVGPIGPSRPGTQLVAFARPENERIVANKILRTLFMDTNVIQISKEIFILLSYFISSINNTILLLSP
ncbi:hypothetical protein [Vibrio penaeicida]|uniref:Uncharacterized protein n=2 Tax=Vibrio penaeicida TaxID=104609 RepID=A0AAV5NY91_9VIBR|nr:hypothetical protein [Vibrio penaeicida]GLQ75666.1 hypothetical protein GCM10007932_50290 [Vibrio penaeicida]